MGKKTQKLPQSQMVTASNYIKNHRVAGLNSVGDELLNLNNFAESPLQSSLHCSDMTNTFEKDIKFPTHQSIYLP